MQKGWRICDIRDSQALAPPRICRQACLTLTNVGECAMPQATGEGQGPRPVLYLPGSCGNRGLGDTQGHQLDENHRRQRRCSPCVLQWAGCGFPSLLEAGIQFAAKDPARAGRWSSRREASVAAAPRHSPGTHLGPAGSHPVQDAPSTRSPYPTNLLTNRA